MKLRALLTVCLLLMSTVPAFAQARRPHGSGYMFAAGGGAIGDGDDVGVLHFGLGGELLTGSRFGLTAEVGHAFSVANVGSGLGIFSPGISYRLSTKPGRTVYLTGGYSLFYQGTDATASGFHVGGGVLVWRTSNRGVRMEGRAQFRPEGGLRIYELRISRAFR